MVSKYLIALLFFASPAFAIQAGDDCTESSKLGENFICRESGVVLDCRIADGRIDLILCGQKIYKKADRDLNIAYQKAIKTLEAPNSQYADFLQARKRLIESQRLWLKFRDYDCGVRESLNLLGSTQAAESLRCQTKHTERRTKDLMELLPL